jgi:hypothetical protein
MLLIASELGETAIPLESIEFRAARPKLPLMKFLASVKRSSEAPPSIEHNKKHAKILMCAFSPITFHTISDAQTPSVSI